MSEEGPRIRSRRSVRARRALLLLGAILLLIMVPMIIAWIGDLTGLSQFSEIYGGLVFWNELSGPSFLLIFFSIIVLTGAIMYLIMVAMDTTEGGW